MKIGNAQVPWGSASLHPRLYADTRFAGANTQQTNFFGWSATTGYYLEPLRGILVQPIKKVIIDAGAIAQIHQIGVIPLAECQTRAIELYSAVLRIDKACPGTGVIDRFLADIVTRKGKVKVGLAPASLHKVLSMLLMLATLRIKAFPKVVAIIEAVLKSPFGMTHEAEIVEYLEEYLLNLSKDEERNKYLISWISYFLVSNDLKKTLKFKPKYTDPVTRSVYNNRNALFTDCAEHKIFVGCRTIAKKTSMLEHLDVFNPPVGI